MAARVAAAVLVCVLGACATPPVPPGAAGSWPDSWEAVLGRTVTLDGTAVDEKLGAVLLSDDGGEIWIDGLDAWPAGYYQGGDRGKRVRVTGKVIRRDDLPVFVEVPGEPAKAGIPVESESELAAARVRYLIADATWQPLD